MATHNNTVRHEQRTAYSAGGIIYRADPDGIYVALIATAGGQRWGLPKGHVRRGEAPEAAAVREIGEETGLHGEVVQHLTTIEYWFRAGPTRIHKYVDLFLVRYTTGSLVPQIAEVDDAQWFTIDEACAIASFEREREVLARVRGMLKV